MNYKLSPSDLTFSYEGFKYCSYQKVVNDIAQPSIPLPSIFSKITGLLKNHYDDKPTSELHANILSGIVSHSEKWVRSRPIKLSNHESTCYINGSFDIIVSFDDGTYGVIDVKTSDHGKNSAWMYSRQLHAYAYALEHPFNNA